MTEIDPIDPVENDNNPYAAPGNPHIDIRFERDRGSSAAIVILAILIVPATVIAGFTTCTGVVIATAPLGNDGFIFAGFAVGGIVALVVFALILRKILTLSRNRHLPPTDSDGL